MYYLWHAIFAYRLVQRKKFTIIKRKIMEKKIYEKPAMQVEAFIANDYCVNCSDSSHHYTDYYFECTAGEQGHQYYITDANGNYQIINGDFYGPRSERPHGYNQSYIYHPCNANHTVRVYEGESITDQEDILYNLYLDDTITPGKDMIQVVIWTDKGTDVHATIKMDPTKWDIAKS